MGRRRRATPYFPPSSSVARVAAHSTLVLSTRRTHRQTIPNPLLSSFHFFPRSPLASLRSSLFRAKRRLFFRSPRFSEVKVAASRCSNARCYNTSRTRCCRYTFFFPFLFSPSGPLQPRLRESTASLSLFLSLFFSIVLRLDQYRFLFVYVLSVPSFFRW